MTRRIRRCPEHRTYTLATTCPLCGIPTVTAHPARFSPEDRFAKYRRLAR